jgi:hypothetical protein
MTRRFLLLISWLVLAPSLAFAQGGVLFNAGLRFDISSQSVADNGGGTAASGTITVLKSYVALTCSDTNGCTMSLSETGARDGMVVTIINLTANTSTFAGSTGVLELDSTAALGQWDSLTLLYQSDRWVEVSRAPGGAGGGSGAPTSAQYVTLATDGTLSNERVLTAGTGISVTDAGAGSTVTVALSGGTLDLASEVTGTLPVANGGTNLTAAADDNVMVGNATTWQSKALTDCDSPTTSKLLYDTTTNAFSCGSDQGAGSVIRNLGIVIDGGGSTITTGVKGFVSAPAACTITSATLLSTDASVTSGSIVIDVWKDTYSNYPPTVADTITASAKPTLSSATKSQDSTLTGWTTSVSAGDILGFKVDSVTTVTRVALFLLCQ